MILPLLKPLSGCRGSCKAKQAGQANTSISAGKENPINTLPRSLDEYVRQRIVFEEDGEDDG